ncbi:MAG: hypothetical protein HKN57_01620 [Xanthomonadales bacterium]|nr:hypothetical protein [Gammaproteobacteria bacterium]MBT8054099.1 hypothetical protein [Gammaproteobacteria bacterium]NND55926.1 hypothetical protein [Xanthomonadales bacterium]NNK51422.1 hypothetical protein [Xanthomonadales bacterium]
MKTAHRYSIWILPLWLLVSSAGLAADLAPETRWADPSSVELDVEFPGEGYHANWELFRCDCGDLLVRAELNMPGDTEKGEILLIGGKAVLTRGFIHHKEEAAASLDAAALMMQLALRLLERSAPAGPTQIDGSADVDVLDEINHIYLDTGSAEGGFQAPWSVGGKITEAGDTRRKFDLNFAFSIRVGNEIREASMRLKGVAEFADTEFPVSAANDLAEWDLNWRNPGDAMPVEAQTLGQLRAQIKAGAP